MFRWLLGLPRKDNREDLARDADGRVIALEVRQGVNHKRVIHGAQIPHRNPALEYRTVERRNWWGGKVKEQVLYSQYPLTGTAGNRVDWEELQKRVADAQARGWDVGLVSMSDDMEWSAQYAEDKTQEGRGVVKMRDEWREEQRRRQAEQKPEKSKAFINRLFGG